MNLRSFSIPCLLASIAVVPGCASGRAPLEHPSEFQLGRLKEDDVWERKRRDQLDDMFERVANSRQSPDAMEWLHVYVLAQVADRQDRDARSSDLERFDARLAAFQKQHSQEGAEFGEQLAHLRDEVKGLRELYGTPRAPLASAARPAKLEPVDVKPADLEPTDFKAADVKVAETKDETKHQ